MVIHWLMKATASGNNHHHLRRHSSRTTTHNQSLSPDLHCKCCGNPRLCYCKFTITQSRVATSLYESIYRLVLITHQSWGPVAGAIAGKCRSGILGPRSSTMGSTLGPRSRHPCALINPHQPVTTTIDDDKIPKSSENAPDFLK